ncbi:MAG: hypothetical protein ACJ789_19605 [Thermomicrobiales bacterium]
MMIIAPGEEGADVAEPWETTNTAPALNGPTVFFFIPERRSELAVVQSWFPDGKLIERVQSDGAPLFTEYIVQSAAG